MTATAPQLPALFYLVDSSAIRSQHAHFRYLKALGAASVAAAVFGSLDLQAGALDVAGLLASALFAVQMMLLAVLAHAKHDQSWYESRAAAESLRTLAWRFAVGGEPFPQHLGEEDAARALAARSRDVLREIRGPLLPAVDAGDDMLPASLVAARRETLPARRSLYLDARIADQQRWYRRKAAAQGRASRLFLYAMMSVAGAGLTASFGQAIGLLPSRTDTAGIAAALVGTLLAYTQSKQYAVQSRAYLLTFHELALLRHQAPAADDEARWARWVADAEEAISREHTMWLASRGRVDADGVASSVASSPPASEKL